ncbi:putative ATPase/class 3 adenylate cyclase [Mycobacterium sp. OAS707]|uniref:ATP-binding protein n=1 Tax=Mycobacterium sp. OAS707 TaxID=2663822 RepID=UPI001789FA03|nr:adenylate/guanylate cyclase domain-containing protein [Mycobacterium sp. OAS707]MBE1546256.1 putative ATPase/class 3 adenylate cyclase [Mycobacterium sp. OAS707]
MVASPPSGVVTFLFTDIEGSTRRWEADAASMRAALLAHDKVLRTAIEAHEGFLFSHTGDGVVAAFASPRAAVDAAIDAQRALELPVRMGIATGEAELRDGDYFGTVLNRAARVMAAGHGGQILIADSTAGLLSGVELMNLGPRRLRDVPSRITLYQVQGPGLRSEFPPVRTTDPNPGNLRPAVGRLVGRGDEVDDIAAEVRLHRLVTLTGVGGVGKTRLALEVAAVLSDEFPDGVWVFELASVLDPAAVPAAVASVLGITQQPGKTVSQSLAAALDGRVRLLVIDNCEHVVDAAAQLVEAILAQSATVRILATSREGLGVVDERLRRVPSLEVNAATELFVERAHSFSADESTAVEEVCRRLDGIPLAIELAASRMESMTATEVRDRLDHRFKLLVGARRGLERHQTLRQAMAWSYDLLDDAERALLQRCSVFAGGFGLQSACAVAGYEDSDEYAVLDLLDALVRKSLLVADRSAGRTRYSMLETIRQFAEEQLLAGGGIDDARTAHAHHYAGKEAEILTLWDGPGQREAYDWFTVELANLRTAFRWAADREDLDDAATIACYAAFLGYCVENYEAVPWAGELIERASAADHSRLAFLCAMAALGWFVGPAEAAVRCCDVGQAALCNGPAAIPFGLDGMMATSYLAVGQPDRAVEWLRARLGGGLDTHAQANIRATLSMSLTIAGREEEAIAAAAGLVDLAETTRNPYTLSLALMADGFAWRSADPDRALKAMNRGLGIAHDSGNRFNESHLTANLAQLDVERGDPLSALEHIGLAIRDMHDSGNITTVRSPLANFAILLNRLEHYEAAATIAGFARSPLTAASFPKIDTAIAHLRRVLGEDAYESLADEGAAMTIADLVAFAYDQIDRARAQLERSP